MTSGDKLPNILTLAAIAIFLCVRSTCTSIHKLILTHATAALHSAFMCITLQPLNVNIHILGIHCHKSLQLIYIQYNVNASHQNTHKYHCISSHVHTRGKVLSWKYRSPRKRNSRPPASVILCWVENVLLIYYASVCLHCKLVCLHWKKSPVYGVLDSNLHTRLEIVTANELGLAFPLGTFPKNFVQIRPRFIQLSW